MWQAHRKIVAGAFSPNQLRLAAEDINEVLDTLVANIKTISKTGPDIQAKLLTREMQPSIAWLHFSGE